MAQAPTFLVAHGDTFLCHARSLQTPSRCQRRSILGVSTPSGPWQRSRTSSAQRCSTVLLGFSSWIPFTTVSQSLLLTPQASPAHLGPLSLHLPVLAYLNGQSWSVDQPRLVNDDEGGDGNVLGHTKETCGTGERHGGAVRDVRGRGLRQKTCRRVQGGGDSTNSETRGCSSSQPTSSPTSTATPLRLVSLVDPTTSSRR